MPCARYAFLNPYNVSLVVGAGVISAATGEWWVGLLASGLECAWLLLAPESETLRRLWFEPTWERERRERLRDEVSERAARLPEGTRPRAHAIVDAIEHVRTLARENTSVAVELMRSELDRLDELALDYVDILERCVRAERHLASFDVDRTEAAHRYYHAQATALERGDPRYDVARKNLSVIDERRARYSELQRTADALRGHLDLIEGTLRLLADEVVGVATPSAIGARVDELRHGVATVRVVAREIDDAERELEASEELAREPHLQNRM